VPEIFSDKSNSNVKQLLGQSRELDDLGEGVETEPHDALLDLLGLDKMSESNSMDLESELELSEYILNKHEKKSSERTSDELDWKDTGFDADEFDENIFSKIVDKVDTDERTTRSNRAMQMAIELGELYGWDKKGVRLLAEVFEKYGWSATKRLLEKELKAGMQPEELDFAQKLRELWREYPEFAVSRTFHVFRGKKVVNYIPHYENLNWPLALAIYRKFTSLPDLEEIEHLFVELYYHWTESGRLQREFLSFPSYLLYRFSLDSQSLEILPEFIFRNDPHLLSDHRTEIRIVYSLSTRNSKQL